MKSKIGWILICMLAVSLVVAGCGGKKSGSGGAKAKTGIVVTVPTQIVSLDPHVSAGTPAEVVRSHIYEGLVRADEKNNIHPGLAEKWEVAADQVTWTFYLKKGVKFHDGTILKASDVKKTFERILDEKNGLNRRYLYTFMEKIEAVNDLTVKIITKQPQSNILNLLAYNGGAIVSTAAVDKWGKELGKHPVGTGPFKLKEEMAGEYVLVEKFADYWGGTKNIEQIKFVTVPEESTRVTMLKTGEADYIGGVPPQEVKGLETTAGLAIRKDPSNRVAHIGFNLGKTPYDNVKVRQALNYAIDRALIVKSVCGGVGEPATSVLAPATWGYSNTNAYTYDVEKAKKLLAEAGFPNGFTGKLYTPEGRYFRDKETALAVAGMWKAIGVNLEVEVMDWAQYLKELKVANDKGNKMGAYFLGWESTTGEANYIISTIFASKNIAPVGWNTMFYSNPRVDELAVLAGKTLDEKKRLEYFKEFQQIAAADAPWAPLYIHEQINAFRSNIKGITVLPYEVPLFTRANIEYK
ncbi:MAG: ABC transporter substrate-binding protein [Negativicutes bacterium]